MASARNILILGGGASGTLLAIQILRADTTTHVTLIERSDTFGKGVAYGSAHPIHLLNVRAANMSAYPDLRDHFAAWLSENDGKHDGSEDVGFRFASRLAFGNYLTSQLHEHGAATTRLTHIRGEAVAISRTPSGIRVTLDNFRRIIGDVAVIATGYESPALSGLSSTLTPWLSIDRKILGDTENILLLGTGLSTIDHVQSLIAAGYQGKIIAISRRGLLPQAHRPFEAAEIAKGEIPFGQSLSRLLKWFRERVRDAEGQGSDWRAVLDGLRPFVQELWQSLSPADQSRFVRHARPWWDVRRHRMAPKVAAAIGDLVASGRLVVIPSKIVSITPRDQKPGSIEVQYRRRGKHEIETLDVQGITDCTGFSIDVSKAENPLVRSLVDQGLARPDRLGLGLDVDAASALIDRNGKRATDIFAIGPLTRGAFWEITGIPDIRTQCARLAEQLTQSSETGRSPRSLRAASE